jgi:hypothetical protein
MKATITRAVTIKDRVTLILDCIRSLYGFPQVTERERDLIYQTLILPKDYLDTPTPFSLTMKKIYQANMKLSQNAINNIINSLTDKGYLSKDSYGEYNIRQDIRRLLRMKGIELILNITEKE